MRQIFLDTETTGLSPLQGHRIIEIAAVEAINRRLTKNHFHVYLNPDREIDQGAQEVHGITLEFLQIVPRFKAGDMPAGIEMGTDAIIKQLTLPADQAAQIAAKAQQQEKPEGVPFGVVIWLIIFFLFFVLPLLRRMGGGRHYRGSGLGPVIVWEVLNAAAHASRGGGGGGWGDGGGSWGGGGGSFGGGGASGSW